MIRYSSSSLFEGLETRSMMSASLGEEPHPTPAPTPGGKEIAEALLHKPSKLAATRTGQAVTLNWQDNSDNETSFGIFRVTTAAGKPTMTQIGTVDANVTTFNYTATLGCNVFVVRAFNDAGKSSGSNAVNVKVEPIIAVTAPNKLRSAAKSSTAINLSWEGDKGAKHGYIIERSIDGQNDWTQIGTTEANKRCFTDTGLTKGTFYHYRITAVGEDGAKATSNVLTGKTKISDGPEPKKSTTTTVRK